MWPKIHEHYSASEIYNCDERGLRFCALAEETLCFKNDKLSGSKKSKKCLTFLLPANMDGSTEDLQINKLKSNTERSSDKLQSFVIRKSANPCSLKRNNKTPGNLEIQ